MSYTPTSTKRFDDLEIDIAAREVRLAGTVIHLTRTEFNLLQLLVERPRQALSREVIISSVWGGLWYGEPHLVSVHMSNLRRKIADKSRLPPLIHTIHGVGYRFDGQEERGSQLASHPRTFAGQRVLGTSHQPSDNSDSG